MVHAGQQPFSSGQVSVGNYDLALVAHCLPFLLIPFPIHCIPPPSRARLSIIFVRERGLLFYFQSIKPPPNFRTAIER
jgi:hypothetical protein